MVVLLVARPGVLPASLILVLAIVFRLLLLPAGYDFEKNSWQRLILYDDDVWRYLWEGHVGALGLNPLDTPPRALEEYELELQDPALHAVIYEDRKWGQVFDNVGYRQFASPYGHVAQAVFQLSHAIRPGSLLVWRLLMIAFDVGSILLLLMICRRLEAGTWPVAAYAWNPLVIKELAGSAHIDAVLVFFLLAGVLAVLASAGKRGSVALALAALVKPIPAALTPAFFKRAGWLATLPMIVAIALMAWSQPLGMKAYAEDWYFNQGFSRFLPPERWLDLALPAVAVGAVVIVRFFRDDRSPAALIDQCLWVFGAFLLTTPMVAPWYFTWLLPFAALRRAWFWLVFSGTVFLSYHAYLEMKEYEWVLAIEYLIPLAAWLTFRLWPVQGSAGRPSAATIV